MLESKYTIEVNQLLAKLNSNLIFLHAQCLVGTKSWYFYPAFDTVGYSNHLSNLQTNQYECEKNVFP